MWQNPSNVDRIKPVLPHVSGKLEDVILIIGHMIVNKPAATKKTILMHDTILACGISSYASANITLIVACVWRDGVRRTDPNFVWINEC